MKLQAFKYNFPSCNNIPRSPCTPPALDVTDLQYILRVKGLDDPNRLQTTMTCPFMSTLTVTRKQLHVSVTVHVTFK